MVLDVFNNVPYLPMSRCDLSPDIPAVPAPSALPGDEPSLSHCGQIVPELPEDHPSPPDADVDGDVVELDGHWPLRSAEDRKADALTLRHMMTHLPKKPFCSHCRRAKMENVRLCRIKGAAGHGAEDFGDLVTGSLGPWS